MAESIHVLPIVGETNSRFPSGSEGRLLSFLNGVELTLSIYAPQNLHRVLGTHKSAGCERALPKNRNVHIKSAGSFNFHHKTCLMIQGESIYSKCFHLFKLEEIFS